jgi:trimeric autotransporter adhesin
MTKFKATALLMACVGIGILSTARAVSAQNAVILAPLSMLTAGTGVPGYIGDGFAATAAELNTPFGVTVDANENIYIADMNNNVIRKVSPAGIITTVAGTGTAGYSGDGAAATTAKLSGPHGVAVDATGNIYIVDTNNSRIREVVIATGIITTIVGNGTPGFLGDNGVATSAEINTPNGMGIDIAGNLYIADYGNQIIRKVSGGTITTIAGTPQSAGFSAADCPAA